MEIVDLITAIKEKHGLSVTEQARTIGVAPSSLTRYMTGERRGSPRLSTMQGLIDLHGDLTEAEIRALMRGASPYKRRSTPASAPVAAPAAHPRPAGAPSDITYVPLVRQVMWQAYDPDDPGDILEYIPIARSIARPGSYAFEVLGSEPPGGETGSLYYPAGTKLVADPSRPLRPGHPVIVQATQKSETFSYDYRMPFTFLSFGGEGHALRFTHATTGAAEELPQELVSQVHAVVAAVYT